MILTALKELAEREGLVKNPDFEPREVAYVVTIGPGGVLHGPPVRTEGLPTKAKGKRRAQIFDVPKRSERTVQDLPEFLVDKAEYVFGWVDPERLKKDAERAEKAAKKRHKLFVEEIRRAFEDTRDEALGAVVECLEAIDTGAAQIQSPEEWTAGNLFGFVYSRDEDGPRLISSRPMIVEYWARRRRERDREQAAQKVERKFTAEEKDEVAAEELMTQCLVTGRWCEPVRLHPAIKGVPPIRDTKGGVPLTSINQEAFESYDLKEFGCAAISQEAADALEKALNRLLSPAYPNPKDGTPLPVRNVRLSDDTAVVFWSREASEFVDFFSDAVQADPEAVAALYNATWKGRAVRLDDPTAFYALTLSGAQGRATIRSWFESTVREVVHNVRQHFDDLRIIRPKAEEGQPFPLWQLLRSTAVRRKNENIHPNAAAEMFETILKGRGYPRILLDTALRRARVEREVFAERAALIKAYLVRARRLHILTSDFPEVKPMLDKECPDTAYRLGRLFAVLEKLQTDATRAGTTIRDRYYGAASSTPVVVFGQLLRKAPHHASKIPHAPFYEKLIQEILSVLRPEKAFPSALTLEEQGLFALGYYHQRQDLFTKRSEGETPETPEGGE